jgi:lytic murein transglycosylase
MRNALVSSRQRWLDVVGAGLLVLLAGAAHAQTLTTAASETTERHVQTIPIDEGQAASLKPLIDDLWPAAKARGVPRRVFDRVLGSIVPDPDVLDLLRNQPEHNRTAEQYLNQLVSQERVTAGRDRLAELDPLLVRIEGAYGVDRHVLLAIWGIESNFGTSAGTRLVARSLATLAFGDPRRAAYWRSELLALLVAIAGGDVGEQQPTGSWAGAMGHTQFMPTSFVAHAVDFDGDGRRDIWTSIPDALASTANYLRASGWKGGEPWGYEVMLPDKFDYALSAPSAARSLFDWMEAGVVPPPDRKLAPLSGRLRLLLPTGATGPAFLVGCNFNAILKYNSSVAYALAVGHLADRIAGAGAFIAPWPAGDRALIQGERLELQQLLLSRGLETGSIDGIIGEQTRGAIRAYQSQNGLAADGYPSAELLQHLRR